MPVRYMESIRKMLTTTLVLSLICVMGVLAALAPVELAGERNDVTVPTVIPLPETIQAKMSLVVSEDLALSDSLRRIRTQAIGMPPPSPVETLHYEGFLNSHPLRIETTNSLQDMVRLASLIIAIQIDAQSLDKSRSGSQPSDNASRSGLTQNVAQQYAIQWFEVAPPTGNPVNANKLAPLLVVPTVPGLFTEDDRKRINEWTRELVAALSSYTPVHRNNWEAKRQSLLALASVLLNDKDLAHSVVTNVKSLAGEVLFNDGKSVEILERDALSYHVSLLQSMLKCLTVAALYPELFGKEDVFERETRSGASIKNSVDFIVPYVKKEQIYKQWVNSRVPLDRKRSESGLPEYQPGTAYNSVDAVSVFALASFFDATYLTLIENHFPETVLSLENRWLISLARVRQGHVSELSY